jgi:hypothetical protein
MGPPEQIVNTRPKYIFENEDVIVFLNVEQWRIFVSQVFTPNAPN